MFGTVRPRLGWTVTPETMIYATGGLAYGEVKDSGTITDGISPTSFSISKTSAGWTAGGGVESHLVGNWTWKLEYLFMELKEPSGTVVTAIAVNCPVLVAACGGGNVTTHIDPWFTDNIVRAGLNYKW
ncbi:MAG TPA: porin family protein [Xanthobacteraceae bacterium]|nr:porin family protein [Xanthobacteraceae bacterium]